METFNSENEELITMAIRYQFDVELKDGYPQGIQTENGEALLVRMKNRDINNGLYGFIKIDDQYHLLVIEPNTQDTSVIRTKVIQVLDNVIAQFDDPTLDVWQWTTIFSQVIANSMVNPLAKQLFPKDEKGRYLFQDNFHSRICANMARYHLGDETLNEENVNAEPHALKQLIIEDIERTDDN